jgi:hypothetical protein
MTGIEGNNADNFSKLWATTLKDFQHCRQQRGTITTMQININKIKTSL